MNQHKWVDRGNHSQQTVVVVTHQVGSEICDIHVFHRLKEANLNCINLMQKQHPELFAGPQHNESKTIKVEEEDEPQTIREIYERENVQQRSTKGKRIVEKRKAGDMRMERIELIQNEDPDADTTPADLHPKEQTKALEGRC